MWGWFSKHAQAFGALFSAAALFGILFQVYAAENAQRAQSARDIYREFVALTISRPELVSFEWSPTAPDRDRIPYEAYVEYLLYTSEQVIAVSPDWQQTNAGWFENHTSYLCSLNDLEGYTSEVEALISEIKAKSCS